MPPSPIPGLAADEPLSAAAVDPDLIELDNGNYFVVDDEDGEAPEAEERGDWFANLAEELDDTERDALGRDLVELVEKDEEDRKKRDEMYARGLERTGIGQEAPGGASFSGASKTTHPALAEATLDYTSRVLRELFPTTPWFAGKPTSEEPTPKERQLADTKAHLLDKLLRDEVVEFIDEMEQLEGQVGLAGSQYLRVWANKRLMRPQVKFVASDEVILASSGSSFLTAQRKTFRERLTTLEMEDRMRSGQYRRVELVAPSMTPEKTRPEDAADRAQGIDNQIDNDDGVYVIYEIECYRRIEGIDEEPQPYLVTIEKDSEQVLAVYRNWEEDDPTSRPIVHAKEFPFWPWRGPYSIGLLHIIGGLAGAATGALRALLDSAHVNNMQTGIRMKGGGSGGETKRLTPTEVEEIDSSVGTDDVRKAYMPLPFNPPSAVLFQLLGFVVDGAKGVVRATLDDQADGSPNVPVGTTLARIDEGTVVFGSIYGRQVKAFTEVGRLIGRVAAELNPKKYGLLLDCSDVVSAADPSVFSETRRMAGITAAQQRAAITRQMGINLYDDRKLEERFLKQLKLPNYEELLVKKPEPARLDPVSENVSASLGRPVIAFPDQDHVAHLISHIPYLTSPLVTQLPMLATSLSPIMLEHVKQHVTMLYAQQTYKLASEMAGVPIEELLDNKDSEVSEEYDRVLGLASVQALSTVAQLLQKLGVGQAVAQSIQLLKSLAPPPMQSDPVLMAEVERKKARDQMDLQAGQRKDQLAAQTQQTKAQLDMARLQGELGLRRAELEQRQRDGDRQAQLELERLNRELERAEQDRKHELLVEAAKSQTTLDKQSMGDEIKVQVNTADNRTALEIAEMEIEAGEKAAVSTGGGLNPSP